MRKEKSIISKGIGWWVGYHVKGNRVEKGGKGPSRLLDPGPWEQDPLRWKDRKKDDLMKHPELS